MKKINFILMLLLIMGIVSFAQDKVYTQQSKGTSGTQVKKESLPAAPAVPNKKAGMPAGNVTPVKRVGIPAGGAAPVKKEAKSDKH